MRILCVGLCAILLLSLVACNSNQAISPEKEADKHADTAQGWPKTPEGLLEHLNSWNKDTLDKCERPEVYPNYKDTGETRGWISEHKEEFAKMGVEIRWNAEEMRYEIDNAPGKSAKNAESFSIYIESWERISFRRPHITEGEYSKMHIKSEAEGVIAIYLKQMKPVAKIMLGKNLHINDKGFNAEIDEIQEWLVAQGIKDITFRLAMSEKMPPVVREYRNGKVIELQQEDEKSAKGTIGYEWPLEEKTISASEFSKSYIETAAESGKKNAGFIGKDNDYYYIAWFIRDKKKVTLLRCLKTDLPGPFPSAEIREKRAKNLPERPSQPPAFRNMYLKRLIEKRGIEKLP
jgi:hypothetical protein